MVFAANFNPRSSLIEHAVVDGHDHTVVSIATGKVHIALKILAEPFKLAVGDVLGRLKDSPLDTLCARRSREGALIRPVGICDEVIHQCINVNRNLSLRTIWPVSCIKCAKDFLKEWVILIRIHCLKENSEDSNLTALVSFLRVSASKMHKVDFCGIIIAFNSVLRGRMEVELKRLEFATLSFSVPEVQSTTVWFDVDLPRIVHCWRFTIFVDLLWFLVL